MILESGTKVGLHASSSVVGFHPTQASKVHTWSNRGTTKNTEGEQVCYFACTGCRALNDKDHATPIPTRRANLTLKTWETNPKVRHSCVPRNYEDVAGLALVRKIKKKVATGQVHGLSSSQAAVHLSSTVATKFADLSQESQQKIRAAAVGNESALKQSMRRARHHRFPTRLKVLADFAEENYPDLFKTFHASNATEDNNDMIVLASPRQLEWFRSTKVIVSDGSFRYSPRGTYQVYRIFGFVADHHCVPLVTMLLNGKSAELYRRMWKKVAAAVREFEIEFALFDFEPASIESFQHYFPGAIAKMCAFHACQATNRRLHQLGLQVAYREGSEVRSIIRRLMAIITVPPDFMSEAVLLMHRAVDRTGLDVDLKAKLCSLIDYFENTWVENRLGKTFLSMLLTGPGTTNNAESYHSKLRDHVPRSHPLLGEWFVIHRELSHHEEERAAAIERGDQQLRLGTARYNDLKRRRLDLRTAFEHFLDTDFTSEEFNSECYRYLGRMGNLLGISPESRKQRREALSEERAREFLSMLLTGPGTTNNAESYHSKLVPTLVEVQPDVVVCPKLFHVDDYVEQPDVPDGSSYSPWP